MLVQIGGARVAPGQRRLRLVPGAQRRSGNSGKMTPAASWAYLWRKPPRRWHAFCITLVATTLLGASACGSSATVARVDSSAAGSAGQPVLALKVVATVSPITSIVENIGGARIQLQGIVPEGVNSHTFAPAPSVAQAIGEADLIVLNGLFLEEPTLDMAKANKKNLAYVWEIFAQRCWLGPCPAFSH